VQALRLEELLPAPLLRAVGKQPDPVRFAALIAPADGLAQHVVAYANTTGGHVLLGATIDQVEGEDTRPTGIEFVEARAAVQQALGRVDPPVEHLVTVQAVQAPDSGLPLALVAVRQSPAPPHLLVPEGNVLISVQTGVRSVQSRAELDALYQRGRAERERADRQIEAMIEKLLQAHYAFYGVGFVLCTQNPSAEPYLWAREHITDLLAEGEAFCSGWKLTEDQVKVRPGEVELQGDREAHGYVRVTRGGCVAVGEVRRRPAGNTLGSVEDVNRRVSGMIDLAYRILAHAPAITAVPRLFYEGLRGQRLIVSEQPYGESGGMELDTAQFPANLGDPTDLDFRSRLTAEIVSRLLAGFGVEYDADAALLVEDA